MTAILKVLLEQKELLRYERILGIVDYDLYVPEFNFVDGEASPRAAIISLTRMMEGSDKTGGIAHLGYLGAFFFFYHFSGYMDFHFWAVFAGGATVLSLESYQIWNYCRDEIQKERDILVELEGIAKRNCTDSGN